MLTTKDVGKIATDDNGAYLATASATRQFKVNVNWSEDKAEVQGVHMDSSTEFYFKNRVDRAHETVHVNKDSIYSLTRYYRKNKSFPGLRQLIVHITPVQKESRVKHCCVVYSLGSVMKEVSFCKEMLQRELARTLVRPEKQWRNYGTVFLLGNQSLKFMTFSLKGQEDL